MIMVAKGDIDYAVCDQQIARMTQKKLPEVDILTDVSFTQLQSWAVRKDSPVLLDSLNSWLHKSKTVDYTTRFISAITNRAIHETAK